VTADELAKAYLEKALKRRRVLTVLLEDEAYSDVVREAQELVELALKGMLRAVGVDPPKWHDVGPILLEQRALFPAVPGDELDRLAEVSRWLRKEREFAFYGDIDFIPTEHYRLSDAQRALDDALFVLERARATIEA
jgi:HEPN domain-containing protein